MGTALNGFSRRHIGPTLAWFAAAAATTALLRVLRGTLGEAHMVLAYLLVVLGASAREGRRVGFALAVFCFLCFNFFLIPPFHTLGVADPLDWLVLLAFLATSAVAAQLLHRARRAASAARALREADAFKDSLLASISHDLRTPLTTIKALAHDLRREGDERAATIEEEADRLNRFVSDLLDLSRWEQGAASPIPDLNAVEDLLGAALQQTRGVAEGRRLLVELDPAEPLLLGRFDLSQTLRALVNLIENGLKYSPTTAPVEVTARRRGEWIEITVADRGPGVAPEDSARIFEPFYRTGHLSDVRGSGLGLAIARRAAEAQHGTLRHRPREGGGSVFELRLAAADLTDLRDTDELEGDGTSL